MDNDNKIEEHIYRKALQRTKVVTLIAAIFFIAFIYSLYNLFFLTPSKPTLAEQKYMERTLRNYAKKQWNDKVSLKKLYLKTEIQGSDFPINREWEGYRYFVYFQIKGTSATFFVDLPVDIKHSEYDFKRWPILKTELNNDEIELLKAYSKETAIPASEWVNDVKYGVYADKYPGKVIWTVLPAIYANDYSFGLSGYVFERLPDGEFKYLEYR